MEEVRGRHFRAGGGPVAGGTVGGQAGNGKSEASSIFFVLPPQLPHILLLPSLQMFLCLSPTHWSQREIKTKILTQIQPCTPIAAKSSRHITF